LDGVSRRYSELQEEFDQTNNKYLKLYDENDKLSEYAQTLQYKISCHTGSTGQQNEGSLLEDVTNIFKKEENEANTQ